jgi:hypothetical protein
VGIPGAPSAWGGETAIVTFSATTPVPGVISLGDEFQVQNAYVAPAPAAGQTDGGNSNATRLPTGSSHWLGHQSGSSGTVAPPDPSTFPGPTNPGPFGIPLPFLRQAPTVPYAPLGALMPHATTPTFFHRRAPRLDPMSKRHY